MKRFQAVRAKNISLDSLILYGVQAPGVLSSGKNVKCNHEMSFVLPAHDESIPLCLGWIYVLFI